MSERIPTEVGHWTGGVGLSPVETSRTVGASRRILTDCGNNSDDVSGQGEGGEGKVSSTGVLVRGYLKGESEIESLTEVS